MLKLKNLTVKTENKTIIKNFNYEFEKNKVYAIMGPNGSGKSTLANAVIGKKELKLSKDSEIKLLNCENSYQSIKEKSPSKRSKMGIFMSFQSPMSLSGVSVFELLQTSLGSKITINKLRELISSYSAELNLRKELTQRSLNYKASGGERKKLEVLQSAILDRKVNIFDEIDTGLDVDALKKVANFIWQRREGKTYIIITHYYRILKYLKPDKVIVLKDGELMKEGDYSLAKKIDESGYDI